jgi:hypothetical protein
LIKRLVNQLYYPGPFSTSGSPDYIPFEHRISTLSLLDQLSYLNYLNDDTFLVRDSFRRLGWETPQGEKRGIVIKMFEITDLENIDLTTEYLFMGCPKKMLVTLIMFFGKFIYITPGVFKIVISVKNMSCRNKQMLTQYLQINFPLLNIKALTSTLRISGDNTYILNKLLSEVTRSYKNHLYGPFKSKHHHSETVYFRPLFKV